MRQLGAQRMFVNQSGVEVHLQMSSAAHKWPSMMVVGVGQQVALKMPRGETSLYTAAERVCLDVFLPASHTPLLRLPIDRVGTIVRRLDPNDGARGGNGGRAAPAATEDYAAWEVTLEGGVTMCKLRSNIQVVNHTQGGMEVALEHGGGVNSIGLLGPGKSLAAPILFRNVSALCMRPVPEPGKPVHGFCARISLAEAEPVCRVCTVSTRQGLEGAGQASAASGSTRAAAATGDSTVYFNVCIKRKYGQRTLKTVHVHSPLMVTNLLPMPLLCHVALSSHRHASMVALRLEPGESQAVAATRAARHPTIRFKLAHFARSRAVPVFDGRDSISATKHRRLVESVTVSAGGRPLRVLLEFRSSRHCPTSIHVSVYTSHWLLDRSGAGLVFGHRPASAKATSSTREPLAVQASPLVEERYQNQRSSLFSWAAPFLPTDRHEWTDESGALPLPPDAAEALRPRDWRWAEEWSLDTTGGVAGDGWDYAKDFSQFSVRRQRRPKFVGALVRRRRYTRLRVPDPVYGAVVPDSTLCPATPASARVAVKARQGSWSSDIDVAVPGNSGVLDVLTSTAWDARSGACGLAVYVERCPRPFHRTKLVTFHPRMRIVNQTTSYLVFVRQAATNRRVRLQPGSKQPFFWTRSQARRVVQVACVATSSTASASAPPDELWSGGFEVDRIDNFPLLVHTARVRWSGCLALCMCVFCV